MVRLSEILLEAPLARAVFFVLSNVAAGVLAGAFIFEISSPVGLVWASFYKKTSFYLLLVLTAVIYLYNRALYALDRDVRKFADSDYCVAYMRSKCLPEAVERYRVAIRAGNREDLAEAMAEFERVIK